MEMYGYTFATESDLFHHGILGQKWGIRRFQNKDGTLTEVGRKRLAKKISTSKASSKRELIDFAVSEIEHVGISNEKELISALHSFREAAKQHVDFYDSPEYYKVSEKAYNETIRWFEKNDPSYINTIRNDPRNRGDLTEFHGFRKTYEGLQDSLLEKAEKDYYNKPKNKSAREQEEQAYKRFATESNKAIKELIGEFGSLSVKSLPRSDYHSTVERVMNTAMSEYAVRKLTST